MAPPKKGDVKQQTGKKIGRPTKEVIPPNINKPALEYKFQFELENIETKLEQKYRSASLFPINLDPGHPFVDDFKFQWPPSIEKFSKSNVIYMEPSAFIQYDEKTKYAGKRTLATKQTSKQNTNITEEYLIFEKTEEHVDQLSIVTMIEREETEAERQFRVGQEQVQQQQTKKKQEKKQEEVVFLTVKEIKNSNLTITRTLPSFSRWLASQLQVLQDRKFFVKLDENQPAIRQNCLYIYDRIFPQVNGVPVVNPNGKYCIKLWHSGKERLIEIDHKIPISFEGDPILPYAQNKALWATLLCKAYLKLYSYRWERIGKQLQTEDDEFDGSFMYALTGFYPVSFSFNNQENQARQ